MKNFTKGLFILFSVILLIYLIWPGPNSIYLFKPLPSSVKSKLDGDVWQVPNIVAFFSNSYRTENVLFYSKDYQQLSRFFFSPIRINHPPEFAYTAIKPYTDSTYLEEFVYPLRDSLYVNGFEPFYEDGQSKYWGAIPFLVDGTNWQTKTTLRFHPSSVFARIVLWFGISLSIYLLFIMTKRILKND